MAGRPKGAKNIRTLKVEQIAARFDLDPFEVLMMIAVGDWEGLGFDEKTRTTFTPQGIEVEEDNIPIAQRCLAAKEATRYLHSPKQTQTEIDENRYLLFLRARLLLLKPKLITPSDD